MVELGVAADAGTLPRPTLGPVATVGVGRGRWRAALLGAYWTSQSATLSSSPTGADFDAWSVEGRVEHGWSFGPFVVGPLVGAGLESIHGAGINGTVANNDRRAFDGVVVAGGFATWRPGGAIGLRLDLGGLARLSQPTFYVAEPPPLANSLVFQPPTAAARASFGADVVF
ncbi:MAG: hypothetical protein ACRENE_08565 [Polyangiaceae bacterium]